MTKTMLIDGAHSEQIRVVVLEGDRIVDFDTEIADQRTLKGNIYLAKVTRVEPSLQAAFVDYGGNRHGFLPFSEIHPDYFRIPVAEREAIKESQRRRSRSNDDDSDDEGGTDDDRDPTADLDVEPIDLAETDLDPDGDDENDLEVLGSHQGEDLDDAAEADETDDAEEGFAAPPDQSDTDGGEGTAAATGDQASVSDDESSPILAPLDLSSDSAASDDAGDDQSSDPEVEESPALPLEAVSQPVAEAPEPAEAAQPDENPDDDQPPSLMALAAETGPSISTDVPDAPGFPFDAASESEAGPQSGETDDPNSGESGVLAHDNGASQNNARGQNRRQNGRGRRNGRSNGREQEDRRSAPKTRRSFTIQEVIKRGQIMLIQVVKEERGTKGAAVTTYLSLAGRYCVLMPNTARGGGISRKITNSKDRTKLKQIIDSLEIPDSMAVIVRTAGIGRTKTEIKRDFDFLAKTWEQVRDQTMQSRAPAVIYEESDLIKRTLRDTYSREVEEVLVQGDGAYREAKDFMKTLMPSHAKRVQPYRDVSPPLFHKFKVDAQLHRLHSPVAELPSGGYLVINLTEALVSIDINSGRSTRERHIEETALKTNMEAATEIGRQLRLRDLAGLIVIDFIDMEDRRNNLAVERRLKDSLRTDRARVQVGRISQLGLLEMSRQRLRPSLLETAMDICPVCAGLGRVSSTASSALQVLSAIEDEGLRGGSRMIKVSVAGDVAFYVLNEKRDELARIERDYDMRCIFEPDSSLIPPDLRIEDVGSMLPDVSAGPIIEHEEKEPEPEEPRRARGRRGPDLPQEEARESDDNNRRRGRRSGRRRQRDEDGSTDAPLQQETADTNVSDPPAEPGDTADDNANDRSRSKRRRRRRRGRSEGRSPLPGIASFLKSASPLPWHIATEPTAAGSTVQAETETEQNQVQEAIEPDNAVEVAVAEANDAAQGDNPAPPSLEEMFADTPEPAVADNGAQSDEQTLASADENAAEPGAPAEQEPADSQGDLQSSLGDAAAEPEPVTAADAQALTTAPEEAAASSSAEEPIAPADPEPADEPTVSAEPAAIQEPPPEEPKRPRRRGWWQKLLE